MNYGFYRVSTCSPELKVADCDFNADKIIDSVRLLTDSSSSLIVFPELSITGYTCGDLFLQKSLQVAAVSALEKIAKKTSGSDALILVGLPLAVGNALYNCAAVLHKGKILALVPKTFIPNYSEFYEKRYFASALTYALSLSGVGGKEVFLSEKNPSVPFGTDILISDENNSGFVLSVELCEDLWVASPPSVRAALAGATVIANLSGSNEIIGKAEYRKNLVKMHSARTVSAYIYANASHDESTQDLVFSGHSLICENGSVLKESKPFESGKNAFGSGVIFSDIDVERLLQERRKTVTFSDCAFEAAFNGASSLNWAAGNNSYRTIKVNLKAPDFKGKNLERFVDPHPFVPSGLSDRAERCREVIQIQAEGLAKRLRHINCHSAVIGLSGGLDSTLALLVTAKAFDLCGFDRKGILAVTMPCFGTTDRTYNNACQLAKEVGAELKEVRIAESVRLHFRDIEQDENVHDVTYENCQARERTQVLMDLANKTNGIVIGTGDLSELALGWCTYNGDQMSMYGVNSSIPKTLVRHLVAWFSDEAEKVTAASSGSAIANSSVAAGTSSSVENSSSVSESSTLSEVLRDILDTPVSPELLPPKDGVISQKTEDLVGPYELHDFFLYYLLRFGFSPAKILFLAEKSGLPYDRAFMLKWLRIFYRRFFQQQFKRSCMPDGAKVGSVNLSPRGDWRMPSDASVKIWLDEIDGIK